MDKFIRDFNGLQINTIEINDYSNCNQLLRDQNMHLSLLNLNIRSLDKHFDELQAILADFEYRFDIIVCTETWNIVDPIYYNISGYNIIYNHGTLNQNDGTVIYVKDTIPAQDSIINIGPIKVIRVELTPNNYNNNIFGLTAIYRSPSTDPEIFINDLNTYIKENCTHPDEIITGDINIDISKYSELSETYLNCLIENGFISTINKHTRVQNNSASCIDHIFLKAKFKTDEIIPIVVKMNITDHYPVILAKTINKDYLRESSKKHYKKIVDYNKIETQLMQVKWSGIYEEQNVDKATENFVQTLNSIVTLSTVELKSITKKKRKPWITNGLISSIRTRDLLYHKTLQNPSDVRLITEYKSYRNRLQTLITKTKNYYYRKRIQDNKNTPDILWNTSKEFVNIDVKKTNTITEINTNNGKITDQKQIADEFNNHYIEIAQQLADKLKEDSTNQTVNSTPYLSNSMYLTEVEENEVAQYIRTLDSNKSSGPDNIAPKLLKQFQPHISKPLTYIINKSFSTGMCPMHFKRAVIIPVFKNGDKAKVVNYRPISLISNLAKIFEKCLKTRIISFIEKYKIISNLQFGFQKGKSTQDALATLTKMIYNALDNGNPSFAVFIDVAKAFDTVDHDLLLEKLYRIGIRGTPHNILKSYLEEREQQVKIGQYISDKQKVRFGVPQGTILGPILFIIYVNDLFQLKCRGNIIAYADDTAIFYEHNSWEELLNFATKDLILIFKWFRSNILTLNVEKTKCILFGCYNDSTPTFNNIIMHTEKCTDKKNCTCTKINVVENIKYLGVYIDKCLNWKIHTQYVTNKLRFTVFIIKKLSQILNIKQLKIMYSALFQSVLSYGIIAWGGAHNNSIKTLETLQKKVLKIIFKKPYLYHTTQLFSETSQMDIRQLYCNTILVHSVKNGEFVNKTYISNTRSYTVKKVIVPRKHKTTGQRCYDYIAARLYNILPTDLRQCKHLNLFKKRIKKWITKTERIVFHNIVNAV
jgi:hypothetical protein